MTRPADLPPQYDPAAVEPAVTAKWDAADAYRATPDASGQPFSVCIPPPNVTAALHLGHALNNTLQDVLVRHARMAGRNAVWLPGTDHAGIATQTVVDKRLQANREKSLKDYKRQESETGDGRERFIEKVQAWKDEYEARITQQLKDMGCSCDWSRQAFTMDEPRAKAVREAFFQLFKDGLIYRGKRLVNWDPVTQTALADDEVEMQEIDGQFYYLKYPLCDASGDETGETITVATTRPETMLGDTAVAVNPDDPRNKSFIGQRVKLPIVGRVIPIIGDDYVVIPDPDSEDSKARMASGFLKVTPAHDPNDYDIGQRHAPEPLPIINVMAPDASISKDHGWTDWDQNHADAEKRSAEASGFLTSLLGLSREEGRRAIVRWFKKSDLLEKQVPYRHAVGHSYRSHVPVEPYYSDQWYLKVTDDKLAGAALRAMDPSQRTTADDEKPDSPSDPTAIGLTFTPARYAKTFQTWHENIRDWCISRQLWWGHRIPVWSKRASWESFAQANPGVIWDMFTDEWTRSEELTGKAIMAEHGDYVDDRVRKFEDSDGRWIDFYICVGLAPDGFEDDLEANGWSQDPDVLDTWFSSALWPMSTLGWPDQTPDLATWNPTSVLCTAREIITLWVSRMVMFNLYFLDRLPFKDVFIHAMIQDGHGQKMSKSLGNGVDPVDIIHSHGSDAMRFTLTSMTTHTQDVRLPVDTVDPRTGDTFTPKFVTGPGGVKVAAPVQEYPAGSGNQMISSYGLASGQAEPTEPGGDTPLARNTSEKFELGQRFATKLWNATRFALANLSEAEADAADATPSVADRWVLSRTVRAIEAADRHLAEYDFHNYAGGLYQFVWNEVCDWYIEAVKPVITKPEGAASRRVLAAVLDASLRLLHPVMPFVTERLWESLCDVCPERGVDGLKLKTSDLLVKARWPSAESALIDRDAEERFGRLQEVVGLIREVRSAAGVSPRERLDFSIRMADDVAATVRESIALVAAMTQTDVVAVGPDVEKPPAAAVVTGPLGEGYLHVEIDTAAESERLGKRRDELVKSLRTLDGRLGNEKYTSKAPAHLVQQTRDQRAAAAAELDRVEAQLAEL
ncbi:MAG: valine--tRNA ligase [Planctomycetota bacterium]